ncbi:MAG: ATP phosphoribosyltransferase regulatory subunit, partial [Planctomycetaceae bacterium]
QAAARVLDMAQLSGDPDQILLSLDRMLAGSATGQQGLQHLRELFACIAPCGWPAGRVVLDVAIARGLDYYTGTIYETILGDLPGIGSVCSGGRYDNLAELFTAQQLPGVGASLGLDRMLAALEELGRTRKSNTPAPVLVTMFDAEHLSHYLQMGRALRKAGIGAEVYPESRNLGRQMKYADRRGFRFCLIAGPDEFAAGQWQLRDLRLGTQASVSQADVIAHLLALLNQP